jgi:hypothetical protein
MNLTPLQERRLQQVKDEIVFLEKQTKKKGIGFAIWFSLACIIFGNTVGYLTEFLTDHKSLSVYIHNYGWLGLLRSWIIWLLASYFFIVRGNHQMLKLKRKELSELNKRYGLTEKATS